MGIILHCTKCSRILKNCCILNCEVCKILERYCFNCNTHRAEDVVITERERLPKISSYAEGQYSETYCKGNLPIESIEHLMKTLKKAFDIACEGVDTKHGDTDEADYISSIMTGIHKKYQDIATIEQRTTWR